MASEQMMLFEYFGMEMNDAVVRAEHVRKVYKTEEIEYMAIRDISLTIRRGEFATVLGPSGSGKTTLLDIIGTLDTPTSGRIFIDGIDVSSLNDNELSRVRNEKIGFIFQSYNLVPYLSTLENVMLPLVVTGKDDGNSREKAKRMLAEIGMSSKLKKKPTELSGGEQQRAAIVRALMNNPPLILADEPTGNLDSKTSDAVLGLLIKESKERGATILMVTHDPRVAARSERRIYLKDGIIEREVR